MRHRPAPDVSYLGTEQPNPATHDIDLRCALEIASAINAEDGKVAGAVGKELPQIARAIDAIAERLGNGGRLIYVGTGSSGRLGAMDAAECPPTFATRPQTVQFMIAGGRKALGMAVEANEDSRRAGGSDMAKRKPGRRDVVVGLSASGRTPYTVAAVAYARVRGAVTIAVTCNRNTPLEHAAEIAIVVEVGPEVIAGSTRLKAATAQKMVVNMLSTGAMTRLGYVYGNLMINVPLKNSKLAERGIHTLQVATGLDRDRSIQALRKAGGSVAVATIMTRKKIGRAEAEHLLAEAKGNLRIALGEK